MFLKERPLNYPWKLHYEKVSNIARDKFKYKNPKHARYVYIITESMYGIVNTFSNNLLKNENRYILKNIIKNFESLDTIEFYEDESSAIGGYLSLTSNKIMINMAHMESDEHFLRTITHELIHLATKKIFDNYIKTGIRFVLNDEKIVDFEALNELLTVYLEHYVCSNSFNIDLNEKSFQFIIDNEKQIEINLKTNFDGYPFMSEYAKFLYALEGKNLLRIYIEKPEENFLDVYEDYFYNKYEKLENVLNLLQHDKRYEGNTPYLDIYTQVNSLFFDKLKEKIDEGISLEDYLKITNYLKENVNINIIENNETISIIEKSIEISDIYYIHKVLEQNKEKLSNFLKEELENEQLLNKLIYDRITDGEDSMSYFSNVINLLRLDLKQNPSYFKEHSEEELFDYILNYANCLESLHRKLIPNIEYTQLKTNYLVFTDGILQKEKHFKNVLISDLNLKEEIDREAIKYSKSKLSSDIIYNKNFLMDICLKNSDLEYFKEVVSYMSKVNPEWFNELLNTKSPIKTNIETINITPLEYIANQNPLKFIELVNNSNGNFEKPTINNINDFILKMKKLLDCSKDHNYLSDNIKSLGYKSFLDMIKVPKSITYEENVKPYDTLLSIYYDLKTNKYLDKDGQLEYNLEKLASLGLNMDDFKKTSEYYKNFANNLIFNFDKVDFVLEHLKPNKSSLTIDLNEKDFFEVLNNILLKDIALSTESKIDLQVLNKIENMLSTFEDSNNLILKVYNDLLKRSTEDFNSILEQSRKNFIENKTNINDKTLFDEIKKIIDNKYQTNTLFEKLENTFLQINEFKKENIYTCLQSINLISQDKKQILSDHLINTIDTQNNFNASNTLIEALVVNINNKTCNDLLHKFLKDNHNFLISEALDTLSKKYISTEPQHKDSFMKKINEFISIYKNYNENEKYSVVIAEEEGYSNWHHIYKENIEKSYLKSFINIDPKTCNDILDNNHPVKLFGFDIEKAIKNIDDLMNKANSQLYDKLENIKNNYLNNFYEKEINEEKQNFETFLSNSLSNTKIKIDNKFHLFSESIESYLPKHFERRFEESKKQQIEI